MRNRIPPRDRFLAQLSPPAREKLLSLAESARYSAGETIYRAGEASLHFYLVQEGQVALEIALSSKARETLMTIGPGGVFGWPSLVEEGAAAASTRAVGEVEVLRIEGRGLRDLCVKEPQLGRELYHAVSTALSARLDAAGSQRGMTAPGRAAERLSRRS
ncbi:MAG TPA: cyclic nucleotide-binding domain-containing protein [Terriglobales bacterium]|jgi:CRP-like cAMP-binding protein|nr:cyclic nucleotide-binding domain-containing protein [Terriglobales bacterium]